MKDNEWLFVVNNSAHYLKTKCQEEFDEVKTWPTVLFSGVVKSRDYVWFKIGQTFHKKKISALQISKPREIGVFDFHLIHTDFSAHISKIQIGGKQKPVLFESL